MYMRDVDPGSGKVPVMECVRNAYGFLGANWRLFLPAAGVFAVLSAAAQVVMGAPTAGATPPAGPQLLAAAAVSILAGILWGAAVLRKAVRDEFQQPIGIGFGADELRLLAVLGSLLLVFLPPAVLLALVVGTVVMARAFSSPEEMERAAADPEFMQQRLSEALGPGGALAVLLLILAVFVIALLIGTRLSLAQAGTVGERRIIVFRSWDWTRGNMFRVLAAIILTALPAGLILGILDAVFVRAASLGGGGTPSAAIYGLLSGFASAYANMPTLALGGILYKGLRPPGG